MKRSLLLSAAALVLLAASPVLADSHDHHDAGSSGTAGGSNGASHGDHKGSGATVHTLSGAGTMSGATGHTGQMGTGGNNPFNGAASGGTMTGTHHDHHVNTGGNTGGFNPTVQGGLNRHTNNGVNVFTPNTHGGQNGVRGLHTHNGNFDSLRRVFNADHRFHIGGYQRPHGWYSHRWTFGEFLPSFFFTRNYWINDWDNYGLYDPPPGTVWVRDGDDALLIDEYTGEIIQVVYGIFY